MTTNASSEPLFSGYTGQLFVGLSIGWLAASLAMGLLPPLLPTIIAELQISPFLAGVGLTVMWLLFSLLQYPGGRLSDGLTRKTVFIAGLGVTLVGLGILIVVNTYPVFLFGVSLVGCGAGAYFIATRARLTDIYVLRRSQAFGINSASGTAGTAIAAGVAMAALLVASWRIAFALPLIMLAGVGLCLHARSREAYVLAPVSWEFKETGTRLLRDGRILSLLIAYSLHSIVLQGVTGFLPTYLQIEKEFTPALANTGFAMVFIIGMVVMPLSGAIADRLRRLPISAASLVLATSGLAGMVATSNDLVVIASVAVLAVGLMAYPPVVQAHLMDLFPNKSLGGDFGAFKMIYTAIGSLGPAYLGFVADQSSYTMAYGTLIVCLVGGVTVTLLLMWRL